MHTENTLEALGNTVKLRPVKELDEVPLLYPCLVDDDLPVVKLDELVVLHPGGQLRKAQMVPVLHRLKNLARHLHIGITTLFGQCYPNDVESNQGRLRA